MNEDHPVFKEPVCTPAWKRFKNAVQDHIEWLKYMKSKDPNFKCDCRVCEPHYSLEEQDDDN